MYFKHYNPVYTPKCINTYFEINTTQSKLKIQRDLLGFFDDVESSLNFNFSYKMLFPA